MDNKILIVSDSHEVIVKLKTVAEFLDREVVIKNSVEEAANPLAESQNFSSCLVSMTCSDSEMQLARLHLRQGSNIPIFLIRSDDRPGSAPPPPGIEIIRLQQDHKKMLQIMGLNSAPQSSVEFPEASRVRLTGESPEIIRVRELIEHVSATDANVLLLGESGTGKEVVARSVHSLSSRAKKPFIAVNCAAIPAELLESELFGYEKGAFTGATTTRPGRFELAEGGTLFLDEIGDMPLPMQVKLLRVIQEKSFERVGGSKSFNSNVRIVAATHQNLEKSVEEGKFRLDLFYRLNVFPIDIPPLRKRIADIPALLHEFAEKARIGLNHEFAIEFDESATALLCDHSLPGNVRELQNLVERMAILYPEQLITAGKLPERYQGIQPVSESSQEATAVPFSRANLEAELFSGKFDLKEYLTTVEKNLIYQALDHTDWVVTQAADSLCLRRTTLIQKIRRLKIENRDKPDLPLSA
jgi:sigma-54 specific flagellar transcriptional regulator A